MGHENTPGIGGSRNGWNTVGKPVPDAAKRFHFRYVCRRLRDFTKTDFNTEQLRADNKRISGNWDNVGAKKFDGIERRKTVATAPPPLPVNPKTPNRRSPASRNTAAGEDAAQKCNALHRPKLHPPWLLFDFPHRVYATRKRKLRQGDERRGRRTWEGRSKEEKEKQLKSEDRIARNWRHVLWTVRWASPGVYCHTLRMKWDSLPWRF